MGPADGRFFVTKHLRQSPNSVLFFYLVFMASHQLGRSCHCPVIKCFYIASLIFTMPSNRSLEWLMPLQAGECFATVQSAVNLADLGMVQFSTVYGLTGSSLLPRLKFSMMDGSHPDGGLFCTVYHNPRQAWQNLAWSSYLVCKASLVPLCFLARSLVWWMGPTLDGGLFCLHVPQSRPKLLHRWISNYAEELPKIPTTKWPQQEVKI